MSHSLITKTFESAEDLLMLVIPRDKMERIIFYSTLAWFLSFSLYFSYDVDFSDHLEVMGYDSCFYIGGDNPKLLLNKILSWNLRHPFFVLINYPVLLVDALLPKCLHLAVFALVSSIITSCSNLLIYKICNQIVIDKINGIIPVILFPTFAHILLLSSQAETYVYTIFFVLLLILLAYKKASTSFSDNLIFAILTGTTLTNCVYFFIVKLWENEGDLRKALLATMKSVFLFIPLFGLTFTGLAFRFFVKHIPLKDAILNDTYKFVHGPNNLLSAAWNQYLSEPFIFHYTKEIVNTPNAEILPDYPSIFFHIFVAFILIFALWGLLRSKPLMRNICLTFVLYNVIIHFVCGYGNNELQLFCGHWIFFIPILIATGLESITSLYRRSAFQVVFLMLAIFFAIYNGYCYFVSIQYCAQ